MKISVVTIAFQEEKNIARTIESVLKQTTTDIEYIICDGKSRDRTVEIAQSYEKAFADRGISYRVYSEKDGGIYDAMNKGAQKATGDYIQYLNAGDWLYDEHVLETVLTAAAANGMPDVIYGQIACVERDAVAICDTTHEGLEQGMSMAHPSSFVKTELMKGHPFDLSYKIAADFNLMLTLKQEGVRFVGIPKPIAYFRLDGVSAMNVPASLQEQNAVLTSHGCAPVSKEAAARERRVCRLRKIKAAIPDKLWYWWCAYRKKTMLPH